MAWTSIPKPTASSITSINPQGKEQYDQATLTYDDANTFYDGVNQGAYTFIGKPASSTWTKVAKPI